MYVYMYMYMRQDSVVRPRGLGGAARTVRATAAAVGPGAVRGAWGGHGIREGGYIYIYIYYNIYT